MAPKPWCDYDGDGFLDLFVSNYTTGSPLPKNTLYHNDGNGLFTRITNALSTTAVSSWGGHWGDYDNDGRPDLFVIHPKNVTGGMASELFHNDGGGVFTGVAAPFLDDGAADETMTDGAWSDLDGDGWIDLFAAVYKWSTGAGANDRAFRYLGDGQFEPLTTNEVGSLVGEALATTAPCFADFDNDGDADVYVPSFGGQNRLHRNDGRGFFEKVQLGSLPGRRAANSAAWADYDNDGDFDLLTVQTDGSVALHRNLNGAAFEDVTDAAGLTYLANGPVWGPGWGDFDNDGDLDLFIARYNSGAPNLLFLNKGDGTFASVDVGSPLREGINKECPRWVDYDNDGFLDLFVACGEYIPAQNLLYRNNLPAGGNANHWLKVKLSGDASNRDGIGASIRVKAGIRGREVWQLRQIASNASFASGPELLAHFGLGDATNVEVLRIEWPSGVLQELTDVAPNQFLTIEEQGVGLRPRTVVTVPGSTIILRAAAAGLSSPQYQWKRNGTNLLGVTDDTFVLNSIHVADAGTYTVEVSDGTEVYLSNPCEVSVLDKPVITQQPQSLTVAEGDSATFTVVAMSAAMPLFYQWRWNSIALPDESSSTLRLANVQAEEDGLYDVVVNDDLGTVVSDPARLTVRLKPHIIRLATNYTVLQGANLSLSVEAKGDPPITYVWRRNATVKQRQTNDSHQSFFTLTNVQPSEDRTNNVSYYVNLINSVVGGTGVQSDRIYLTVLRDTDGDGMDDPWEWDNGFDPNSPADAALDWDGDGQSNGQEYQAGTDPLMRDSYLKVDRILVSGEARLEFQAAANKTYTVQYKETADAAAWKKLADVVASPQSRTVVVTDPAGAAQRYDRLVTPVQP